MLRPPSREQIVLLVDDEPAIQLVLQRTLERHLPGVDVRTACSADEAIDVLAHQPVDVLVTDFKMPGKTGLDLLEHARHVAPNVPRILMTGYAHLDLVIEAVNHVKVWRVLTKPLSTHALVAAVEAALAERRAATTQDLVLAETLHGLTRKRKAQPHTG